MNALATVAAGAQLLVAAAFVSIPVLRARVGDRAKVAAEAELRRQGARDTVLEENGMRFDAGGHETWAPVSIAVLVAALAALNFFGSDWGPLLTWIFQSLVLLGNGVILYSQLTAVQSVRAAFERKGDPTLMRIDVPALLKAAEDAFPSWTRVLTHVRHTAVFGGSVLAVAVTALAA
ncbi:hypothetical protein ABZO31_17640 [Streptomyces sp. HUAS MG47]|uniref:hypothetical protein n=1 Tax=Streptomyces solicamelliae TaxID=3231716 RepID=UPI0038783DB6